MMLIIGLAAIADGTILGTDVPAVVQKLFKAAKPTASPTTLAKAVALEPQLWNATNPNQAPPTTQNILQNALGLMLNGVNNADITSLINGLVSLSCNHFKPASHLHNFQTMNIPRSNNPYPFPSFYYLQTLKGNAPFSVSESQLLKNIYIPPSFTGKKQPIIFVPGTGSIGSTTFQPNIGKLLSANYDPVYLQIPNNLLDDIQVNAEYVAYAVQYMYQRTGKKPAVITWSQGSLVSQWAFKYWKTTRAMVTDLISISPDFHGTFLALLLCPGFTSGNAFACVPSVFQQTYDSNFVTTLRSNSGDSAYVPTTTVYTAVDEIVEPQQGTAASGFINDARGVGVSNTFLQGACLGLPAGGLYGHAGVLINPTAYALVVDALTHDGPGNFNRVSASCSDIVAPGLGIGDVTATEALIPEAVFNILAYLPKVAAEPAIKAYTAKLGQS
jgi:hypothetical protein